MLQFQSLWIGRIIGGRYKLISILATILILGLGLYLLPSWLSPLSSAPKEVIPVSASETDQGWLFQDEFTNPNSGWPSQSQANASFGYQDPTFYFLELTTPKSNLTVFHPLNLADFTAKTKLSVNYSYTLSGDFRAGLAFRRAGDNFYAFTVSPNTRTWQVLKHTPSNVEVLAQGRHSSIRDSQQIFTLSVTAHGTTFTFHINDEFVVELTDPDYASGEVGFIVETLDESWVRIIYDALDIQELEGESAAALPSATPAAPAAVLDSTPTATSIRQTSTLTPTPLPRGTSPPSTALPILPTIRLTPSPTFSSPPTTTLASPSPTFTTVPLLPTQPSSPTSTSNSVPAVTPAPPTSTPGSAPTASSTSTPTTSLPAGTFVLLKPLDPTQSSFGPVDFEWQWTGPVPAGYGFEVRVWREGEPLVGAHDAVLDNQNGNVKSLGENKYALNTNIKDAAGVKNRAGEYLWTVALV
ncbi:MAG TPA: hypothetical protein VEC93_24260, partial [Anaerolineae bacterium]|nr:hypothetical protein [Anaerolineae bacterium]